MKDRPDQGATMPAEFIPKPLPYVERLQKVQRILRSAQFRADQRLAIRELCEALIELTTGLLEREQWQSTTTPAKPENHPPPTAEAHPPA
jgi:hypothetical protein